jgi:hypothetical protein
MQSPVLNFDNFELPFIAEPSHDELVDNEEELEADEAKEKMESLIPDSANCLGVVEAEIDNWTSWSLKDEYYICPLNDGEFDWALFRISWDDNWGRWDWSFDCRLKDGSVNYREAARIMLSALWEKWGLDIYDAENEAYSEFLDGV